jgi:hypothetical protein
MAHLKMEGLEAGILPVLVKCFPRAFFPSGRVCRPLRIGIFEDLNAVLPLEIDRAELKACLGLYTGQPGYLRELKPGAIRVGLNGRATGRVSPKEAASAAARLQKLHGLEKAPPAADASPCCSASAPQISPAPPAATPHGGAINPLGTPFRTGLGEALPGKKGAQTGQQKIIVVVKRRKVALESPQHRLQSQAVELRSTRFESPR